MNQPTVKSPFQLDLDGYVKSIVLSELAPTTENNNDTRREGEGEGKKDSKQG